MSRARTQDLLQTHRFWLLDISPSFTFPFFVLGSPVFGFQSISSPEYTFETRDVKQMNSMFKRTVYEGGGLGTITLQRGVRAYDDTFWQWVKRAIDGADTIDRDFLLVHFTGIGGSDEFDAFASALASPMDFATGVEYVVRLPGKAWILWGCIPTRYKPASDFDAASADVSLMELDIQPWAMTEFTLMSPL